MLDISKLKDKLHQGEVQHHTQEQHDGSAADISKLKDKLIREKFLNSDDVKADKLIREKFNITLRNSMMAATRHLKAEANSSGRSSTSHSGTA